jgi:hypothetical protein
MLCQQKYRQSFAQMYFLVMRVKVEVAVMSILIPCKVQFCAPWSRIRHIIDPEFQILLYGVGCFYISGGSQRNHFFGNKRIKIKSPKNLGHFVSTYFPAHVPLI